MKKFYILFLISFFFGISFAKAQAEIYQTLTKSADSLFKAKEYKKSTYTYTWAFRVNGWRGTIADRYNAARAWSMLGVPDSAYHHLLRMAQQAGFSDYERIINDEALTSLHDDRRWGTLLKAVRRNEEKAAVNMDRQLKMQLETIGENIKSNHAKLDSLKRLKPQNPVAIAQLTREVAVKDSAYKEVLADLWNTVGWVGPGLVGRKASEAQLLVLKYASSYTQKKYLPELKKAVRNYIVNPYQLAILEDIIALSNGKKQIYGSQVACDENGKYYLPPIADKQMLNELRAEAGLPPIHEFLKQYGLTL
ncbi:DUF6624 domain-containing protein [Solitalea canadensis]|uniref:Uncharacterized protein n=1 Tax=Solitalea canadensis (strain ATCC 29591 / DSM 3403 / JCM 21819 / LMG 8368 / NBRC 15130 / NCIMB 12057 / USAM 9D) TaxID=929556 RepID=H8KV19_SOLCM|nr:DUF6624 domain-containing protein [Solitalea canadensis]AFD06019.1 hypothetical protein Solca_0904 [Solitalea canadensis DSM 3403]